MKKSMKRAAVIGLAAGLAVSGIWNACRLIELRPAGEALPSEDPGEGVGRKLAAYRYLGAPEEERIGTAYALDEYVEGDAPVPAWWNPGEEMAVEWSASYRQVTSKLDEAEPHPPAGIDQGGVDWNLCTSLVGWDGHMAEIWEIDLFTRVFYLEFWQPDVMLCEAGCDAILRLWESGEKGRTLGEVLSSKSEDGDWTYSVYPQVWETNYDADGLAWCRQLCEERFYKGPEWIAPYVRLDHYHDWAIPAYQIGNVYFSMGG